MPLIATDLVKRLRIPAYIVTGYMAIGSVLDIIVSTSPALLHDLRWRLGIESLGTGASGTELLAVLIFLAFAWAAADRVALGVGFAYSAIASLAYVVGSATFVLDSLQIRRQIPAEQMARYDLGLLWTAGRLLFTGLVLAYLAVVAIGALRRLLRETERSVPAGPGTIVVNRPPATPERVKV